MARMTGSSHRGSLSHTLGFHSAAATRSRHRLPCGLYGRLHLLWPQTRETLSPFGQWGTCVRLLLKLKCDWMRWLEMSERKELHQVNRSNKTSEFEWSGCEMPESSFKPFSDLINQRYISVLYFQLGEMKRKQLKEEVVAVLSEKFWAAKLLISETLTRASYLPE